MHPDWIQPEWPVPTHVRSVFTTRAGGVSSAPWSSLNLGDHVGDEADSVRANRAIVAAELPARATYLQQVHGAEMVELPLTEQTAETRVPAADGALTQSAGQACCVMVADCLPILLTNRCGTIVAAVHAGWRGLAGADGHGVLEAAVDALIRPCTHGDMSGDTGDLFAWLGPCIGPTAFEVGSEVREAFVAACGDAAACFSLWKEGKWLADLPGLARQRLKQRGVHHIFGNDGSLAWCTFSNPSRFFSHRRDGVSGRHAAFIWLE